MHLYKQMDAMICGVKLNKIFWPLAANSLLVFIFYCIHLQFGSERLMDRVFCLCLLKPGK